MASILGLRDSTDYANDALVTAERPYSWREMILIAFPNGSAPLTALLNLMAAEVAPDSRFYWWEKDNYYPAYVVNDATLSGDSTTTTIKFDDGSGNERADRIRAGDLLMVYELASTSLPASDPEFMRATANGVAGTGVAVTRGIAGTKSLSDNDKVINLGPAIGEGAAIGSGLNLQPSEVVGYCQIFRNPLEMTNTARAISNLRTGDQTKEAKREALEQHSVSMELAFLKNPAITPTTDPGTGKPLRFTRGIDSFLSSSLIFSPSGGNITDALFDGYVRDIFKYGSQEKLVLAGAHALMVFNQMARAGTHIQAASGSEFVAGMRLQRYMTPHGDLVIRQHPLLTQNDQWTKQAYILDLPYIKYRYLNGRDTKFVVNREDPGDDSSKEEFVTEAGLEVHLGDKVHARIDNMDAYTP